jgi:hypothetical protein
MNDAERILREVVGGCFITTAPFFGLLSLTVILPIFYNAALKGKSDE